MSAPVDPQDPSRDAAPPPDEPAGAPWPRYAPPPEPGAPAAPPPEPAAAPAPPPLARPRAATLLLTLLALFPLGLAAQALWPAAGLVWTQLFVFGLPAAALAARAGLDPKAFLRLGPPPPLALALAVPVGAAALLLGGALQALWMTLLPPALLEAFDVARVFDQPPASLVVIVLAATVLAPLCEEVTFRGFLLSALRLRLGPRGALVLSALAFAAMHLDPVRLPGLLFLGLLYGWLSWRAGSVWPAVVAHAVNNAAATALALQSGTSADPATPEPAAAGLALALGAALLWPLARAYHRSTGSPPAPEQALAPGGSRTGRWPGWVKAGVLLAAVSLGFIGWLPRR